MWASICLPQRSLAPSIRAIQCLSLESRSGLGHRGRNFCATPLRLTVREDILADENTDLLKHLQTRNLIHSLTSRGIRGHLNDSIRSVYAGVDPSAASLHVGNLLPLLILVHFAKWGHKPIVLVGGATGSIGDPSGRATERNALDPETLQTNVLGITAQLRHIFRNVEQYFATEGETTPGIENTEETSTDADTEGLVNLGMRAILLNNYSWTSGITLLEFLSTVGRQARMTTMLNRESVASRLNADNEDGSDSKAPTGMSFTEFSYQLLQANDFAYLHQRHSCSMQIGGSDQLGNIMAGIDLIRRNNIGLKTLPAYGLTTPLLTTSSGEKFGKSAGNAVWLDPEMTSDMDFYQFFFRTADEDVERYLMALTLLPLEQIRAVVQQCKNDRAARKARKAQRLLASHLTMLIRGPEAARKCGMISQSLFKTARAEGARDSWQPSLGALTRSGPDTESLRNLDLSLLEAEPGLVVPLSWEKVIKTRDVSFLLLGLNMVKTRTEAKRLLMTRAVYLNNQQILAEDVREVNKILVKERHLLTSLPPLRQRPSNRAQDSQEDTGMDYEDEFADASEGPQKFFDATVDPPKYFVLKIGRSGPQKIVKVVP